MTVESELAEQLHHIFSTLREQFGEIKSDQIREEFEQHLEDKEVPEEERFPRAVVCLCHTLTHIAEFNAQQHGHWVRAFMGGST